MTNLNDTPLSRRGTLKATGGVLGGLALGAGAAPSVVAQSTYYRYDELEALLVDVDADPPAFRRVRTSLFLPEPLLEDCNTDHPCSIDVIDFESTIDVDDEDDDDDTEGGDDDDGDDDDDACPDYGAVTLLCHGATLSDAVALTGLVPDVLSQYGEEGFDFVVELTPSDDTNVTTPETVSNPCPAVADDDDDGGGGGQGGGDDDGDDDDDSGDDDSDDGGDDQNDDNGNDDNDD